MELIVSLSSWILASICNAVMDTSDHHFHTSIFKNKNPMWWNAEVSWKNKYVDGNPQLGFRKIWKNINYPVQLTDSWHFFKMWMIVFITISIVTFKDQLFQSTNPIYTLFYILIYGIIWNSIFSLFYNKILRKK